MGNKVNEELIEKRLESDEDSKIKIIVNELIQLYFEFDSLSKEYMFRKILQLVQKFEWKLPESQTQLKDLILELRKLTDKFYEITDEEFPLQRHEIKGILYRIKNDFLDVIPGEDLLSPDKEYFTASEILERISID